MKFVRKWRGIFKLCEEMNELGVELNKLLALPPGVDRYYGSRGKRATQTELIEQELGDVQATIEYLIRVNKLNRGAISAPTFHF